MRGVEGGALRRLVRDELAVVGFVPTASKLYRPSPGLVSRSALVGQVQSRRGDVVAVTAPAGYGKSTFLAELAANDPRPTAWVSLTSAENDPAAFLTYVALALDDIEPVDPRCVTALWGPSLTIGSPALQQFGAMLANLRQPFMLVLDDVHELASRDVLDTLPLLVAEMPPGSSVVLGSRTAIPLPVGRLRVRRRLVEVGAAELTFDEADAAALFRELDVHAAPEETTKIVQRTEGWPVALYLAALAHGRRRGEMAEAVDEFAGDDRFLVEYFGDELLGEVDADVASFLMEASCLEQVSGNLCDEVLGRSGSAQLLAALQRQNLLVIPLDERREWYRFHHLIAEFLHSELSRRDPARLAAVHLRASEWCDAHGDGDGAVTHAVRGGDVDRAESMVLRWFYTVGTAARLYPTTTRWVAMFSDDELGDRPELMIVAAWNRYAGGRPGAAVQWLARAAAALPERYPDEVPGPAGPVALAMARSIIAPLTPAEMATEATYAYEHIGLGGGHSVACFAMGAAAFMLGDEVEALRRFREGADTTLDRPLIVAHCLAHLAIVDVEHGRWKEAMIAARAAWALLGETAAVPSNVFVAAVRALVETHAGRGAEVDADRQLCRQHLSDFFDVAPWLNLQVRIALARAAVLRGNHVEATTLLDETTGIFEATPGAVRVAEQIAALRREVAAISRSRSFGPSSLTTAELRVLRLLPTHLSHAEIGERLYVSRNTVKTHTIAIYRKLGTSSRRGAVDVAIAAGLLNDLRHA